MELSFGGFAHLGEVLLSVRLLAAKALDYSMRLKRGDEAVSFANYAETRLVENAFGGAICVSK